MDILVGGFNQRHLKNMLVKMGSSSPSFGVKIPKIFELPPPSFFLPHENNVEKLRQIPRASQKTYGSLGLWVDMLPLKGPDTKAQEVFLGV